MPIVGRFGSLAGLGSLTLPGGAMESIATVTVASGFPGTMQFTNIPGTFQHLQLRWRARLDNSGGPYEAGLRFNSDTGANYAWHQIMATGSGQAAQNGSSVTLAKIADLSAAGFTAGVYTVGVITILDYASTAKKKTVIATHGFDANGSGRMGMCSGFWNNTNAVTTIDFTGASLSFLSGSTAALYGITAP